VSRLLADHVRALASNPPHHQGTTSRPDPRRQGCDALWPQANRIVARAPDCPAAHVDAAITRMNRLSASGTAEITRVG